MDAFITTEAGFDLYSTNGYFWHADDGSRDLVYPAGTLDTVVSLTLADVLQACFYSVGAAYRKELFSRIGGYRVEAFGEDYDFWLRAMATGARHRYLPKALSLHRIGPARKSADARASLRSNSEILQHLVANVPLSASDLAAARAAIIRIATDQMREEEAHLLTASLSKLLPGHQVEGVSRFLRRVGVVLRPLRRLARFVRAKSRLRN
jgi:hypothetical protein